MPISRRVVKPAECVLAFGIPTTRAAFERAYRTSHFIQTCSLTPTEFEKAVVEPLAQIVPRPRRAGVHIREGVTYRDLPSLFQLPVVVLFSHWAHDGMELADGVATVDDVVRAVPVAFDGMIDLCVCHPTDLVVRLFHERPKCLVKFVARDAAATFWLYFYDVVFTILRVRDCTYPAAIDEAAERLKQM